MNPYDEFLNLMQCTYQRKTNSEWFKFWTNGLCKKIKCAIMIHHYLHEHYNSNKLYQYRYYPNISHNSSVISIETTSNTILSYRFWAWIKYPSVVHIKITDPPQLHVHVYWEVSMTFSNFYISLCLKIRSKGLTCTCSCMNVYL